MLNDKQPSLMKYNREIFLINYYKHILINIVESHKIEMNYFENQAAEFIKFYKHILEY